MSKPIVEAPPSEILNFEIQEMLKDADLEMEKIDNEIEESLRNPDGSINTAAVYRKVNSAGRRRGK